MAEQLDLAAILQSLSQPSKPDIWQALGTLGQGLSAAGRTTVGRPAQETIGGALGGFAGSLAQTRQQDQANKLRQLQTLSAVSQLQAVDKKQKRDKYFEDNKDGLVGSFESIMSKTQFNVLKKMAKFGDADTVLNFIKDFAKTDATGNAAANLARIRAEFKQPTGKSYILNKPTGGMAVGDKFTGILRNGGIETTGPDGKPISVPLGNATTFSLTGGEDELTSASTKATRAKAAGSAADAASNIANAASLLQQIERAPKSQGFRGLAGTAVGGVVGQLNKEMGNAVTQGLTGIDPQTLQRITTRARTVVAAMIPEVTGEEGSRVSEPERELSREALRLVQPGASFAQVTAALQIATQLSVLRKDREVFKAGGKAEIELLTPDGSGFNKVGAKKQIARLKGLGLNTETIIETLEFMRIQRLELRGVPR